ncbi:hypothetical protein Tco_1072863 [Tanacetum coccineum]
MDDPDITMEEYIQLEAEKARRRGQEFNWETASYGKVRYFKDINYFKDFENEFPAIVYKDALTSKPKVSFEPTVCWNSRRGPEFTWEWEDQMLKKYPHFFANPTSNPTSSALRTNLF